MFIGILDISTLSIRTWENLGLAADFATGRLAGPSGAYLLRQGLQKPNSMITFRQGENLGRPGRLNVEVTSDNGELGEI